MFVARIALSRHRTTAAVAAALVLLSVQIAPAEVFTNADWYFGTNSNYVSGVGSAAIPTESFNIDDALVGFVSAQAHADYLSLGTAATFSTTNTAPTPISEAVARSTAETLDILTPHGLPAGTPGFLVYELEVSGTNSATLSPTHAGEQITSGGGVAYSAIVGYRAKPGDAVALTGSAPTYDVPAYLPPFQATRYDKVPVRLTFPITYETAAAFYVILTSRVDIDFDPTVAETFAGVTDFGGTATITALELQDATHQPVAGASLSASSGTQYPGVTSVTATTLTTTTTTLPPGSTCDAVVGLARARCSLEQGIAGAICSDPMPASVEQSFRVRLVSVDGLLVRALGASGAKQGTLARKVRNKLAAVATKASAAARTKRAKKRISTTCSESIHGLVGEVVADLP
ncbi:MAG: hypothetical protein U0807_14430 [Candidatus Binatia bacterium]